MDYNIEKYIHIYNIEKYTHTHTQKILKQGRSLRGGYLPSLIPPKKSFYIVHFKKKTILFY